MRKLGCPACGSTNRAFYCAGCVSKQAFVREEGKEPIHQLRGNRNAQLAGLQELLPQKVLCLLLVRLYHQHARMTILAKTLRRRHTAELLQGTHCILASWSSNTAPSFPAAGNCTAATVAQVEAAAGA